MQLTTGPRRTRRLALLISTTFAATALSGASLAQEGPVEESAEDQGKVDIITVTAQFREQNLQDTPLAISAVTGEMLERRSQIQLTEVARQVPNVTLAAQNQEFGSAMIAYIRGIGQSDPNFAVEPGVGVYIDDVYLPTLTGSLLDLIDVDRVEVLRGPQGTLAGRNSIGGAIKMYSVKPQGDNSGSIRLTYGSYDRLDLRGIYDVALSDTLSMRLSGVSRNEDGYIDRLDYALSHPGSNVPTQAPGSNPKVGTLGGVAVTAGKAALRWDPNEQLEVNFSADYTRERNDAGPGVLLFSNASGEINNDPNRPFLVGTDGQTVPYNCQFVPYGPNSCDTLQGYDPRYVNYGTFNNLYPGDSQFPYNPTTLDPHRNLDSYGFALNVDYALSDTLAVKSITSYRDYEADWAYDLDGSPLGVYLLNQNQTNEQLSQELRLSGSLMDEFVDFTVGGYYLDTDGFYTARVNLPYAAIDFIHGPDPTPSKNQAVFFDSTLNITDAFHLTGGVRQSWDEKEYQWIRRNPDLTPIEGPCPFFLGAPTAGPTDIGNQPNCLLFGIDGTGATFENDRLDWRVAADYRFSEQFMVYGQIATGYRAGGFNARPFFPSQATPHTPETIRSYEIGFKSDLLNDRLRLNAAAFTFDYEDIVLLSTFCADLADLGQAAPCERPSNVGSAEVKGLELEANFYPTNNFSIDTSLGLLDFEYTEIAQDAATGVSPGDITPYTPEVAASVGAQYDVAGVLGGDLSFRVDAIYQSEIFTEAGNTRADFIPNDVSGLDPAFSLNGGGGPIASLVDSNLIDAYTLVNGRVFWTSADDAWGVAVEVQNLADEYYFHTKASAANASANVFGSPGKPRTWAITVTRNF